MLPIAASGASLTSSSNDFLFADHAKRGVIGHTLFGSPAERSARQPTSMTNGKSQL